MAFMAYRFSDIKWIIFNLNLMDMRKKALESCKMMSLSEVYKVCNNDLLSLLNEMR